MREIKFRGINVNTKTWVYGDLLHKDGKVYIGYWVKDDYSPAGNGYIECEVIPETVGQYTGSKERTREYGEEKEIYFGQIVRCYGGEYWEGFWEHNHKLTVENFSDCFEIAESEYVEIIGNIHENPELLK
jgi:hypothetical protein